ncbi:hypothetical protein SY89_02199 [Halolamina pelagica]|uniref:CYTH domain-containing protein n=1 Tax=Halolamina pelagica TaxID=699431 RepID=A0A0P7GC34_9EURY|nr:hypothetical protein SY89_02199 [Halolamina pelagica]
MYEVELKVEADHTRVRSALSGAGATPVDHVRQVDTYYDAPTASSPKPTRRCACAKRPRSMTASPSKQRQR